MVQYCGREAPRRDTKTGTGKPTRKTNQGPAGDHTDTTRGELASVLSPLIEAPPRNTDSWNHESVFAMDHVLSVLSRLQYLSAASMVHSSLYSNNSFGSFMTPLACSTVLTASIVYDNNRALYLQRLSTGECRQFV